MHAARIARIGQRERANHIHSNRVLAMRLAPIDVGAAREARRVEHVRGLHRVELASRQPARHARNWAASSDISRIAFDGVSCMLAACLLCCCVEQQHDCLERVACVRGMVGIAGSRYIAFDVSSVTLTLAPNIPPKEDPAFWTSDKIRITPSKPAFSRIRHSQSIPRACCSILKL